MPPSTPSRTDPLQDLERILAKVPVDAFATPPLSRRVLASAVTELRHLRVVASAPVNDIAALVEKTETVYGATQTWQRINLWLEAESE